LIKQFKFVHNLLLFRMDLAMKYRGFSLVSHEYYAASFLSGCSAVSNPFLHYYLVYVMKLCKICIQTCDTFELHKPKFIVYFETFRFQYIFLRWKTRDFPFSLLLHIIVNNIILKVIKIFAVKLCCFAVISWLYYEKKGSNCWILL